MVEPEFQTHDIVGHARIDAEAAALASGHLVQDIEESVAELRSLADLFSKIWGTSPESPPINSELLRGLAHADSSIVVARDDDGNLSGGSVAVRSGTHSMYSLIAGVRTGLADRGIGFALKLHQRAWALARGITEISWTFDPLVSRNARFNLVKLGATAADYSVDFYGLMADAFNAGDESDRLTAHWQLDSPLAMECSARRFPEVVLPADAQPINLVMETEPIDADLEDLQWISRQSENAYWIKVPADIVALRTEDPQQARRARLITRQTFQAAFHAGYAATGITRDGWYRLEQTRGTG